jgi:transcriptional regulator with XRE-family HTH domain
MSYIRDIRRQLGLTQTEMADRLGLNQSTISRFERGDLPVDKRTALAVRSLLPEPQTQPSSAAA